MVASTRSMSISRLASFQSQVFLKLQRTQRSKRPEVVVQGRNAHPCSTGEVFDTKPFREIAFDPIDHSRDLVDMAAPGCDLPDLRPTLRREQPDNNLCN